MRLLPEDMGTKWHILTVRNRALGVASVWTKPVEPRLGKLGKRWIEGLPISEEVAAATLPLTADTTNGMTWGLGTAVGITFPLVAALIATHTGDFGTAFGAETVALAIAGATGYGAAVGLPRQHLKKLHCKPLEEQELESFLQGNVPGLPPVFGQMAAKVLRLFQQRSDYGEANQDELEREFLLLVRDVLRCQTVPAESQDELRSALRAIGEALCRLPSAGNAEVSGGSLQAAEQRDEAQMLNARADRESDPIIANSLRRQADALEAAARASENAVVVSRRVRVLRQELRAQIEVLRLTLPTWGRPGTTHTGAQAAHSEQSLGNIAESVRSVAREAAAVSSAQDELNDFLHGRATDTPSTYGTDTAEDRQTIRLR